jgi:fructose-bisphosphate aldolase class II
MLTSGREVLAEAVARKRAAGCFSTYNIDITRAIVAAAQARRAPVFIAIGRGALEAAGFEALTEATLAAADKASVPVAVHLDHARELGLIAACIEAGFTSVMVDGSRLPFAENVALTTDAISVGRGATIEAELGGIAGDEDRSGPGLTAIPMTDPEDAAAFVAATGVESLAVAIGNAHGVYAGEPRLDFGRLAGLREAVPAPLVLHGASGISDADIRRCIDLGVRKVNVNTEIRMALFEALPGAVRSNEAGYDVVGLSNAAVSAMRRVVEEKLALFWGSRASAH